MIKPIIAIIILFALTAGMYYLYQSKQSTSFKPTQPDRLYKVGIIQTASNMDPIYKGFIETMKKSGYEEGKNIQYYHLTIDSNSDQAKQVAKDYIQKRVDVIVSWGNLPAKVAQQETEKNKIPVVFFANNPLAENLIASYQKPGGNLTGVDSSLNKTATKRMELLKQMAPNITKVLFFYNNPNAVALEEMESAAKILNIKLVEKKVASVEDLDRQILALKTNEYDAIYRTADSIISPRTDQLITLSLKQKVPFSGTNAADTEKGGLMSYGTDFYSYGEQTAVITDKILKGANPQNTPTEQAKETTLTINLKTAALLGITIPDSVLKRANRVIK